MIAYENPKELIRKLKGAPATILIAMMLAKHPVGIAWIVENSCYGETVIRSALKILSEPGVDLVQRNKYFTGWILTRGVRQLPFLTDIAEDDPMMQLPDGKPSESEGFTVEPKTQPSESDTKTSESTTRTTSYNPQNPRVSPQPSDSDTKTSESTTKTSESEGCAHLASLNTSLNTSSLTRENLARSDIAKILDDAGVKNPSREKILAFTDITVNWVKEHLASEETPLAIYRMVRHWDPQKGKYPRRTQELLIPPEPHSYSRNAVPDEPEEDLQQGGEVLPASTEPIPGTHFTVESLWVQVLGQLQVDWPKASFETWIKPARPEGWEGETLILRVANDYGADWLRSRLASTIDRLLVGLTNGILKHVEIKTDG